MKNKAKYLGLNKSEFLYLAVDDLVPSVPQLITMRFDTKHTPIEIKSAFLKILNLYPRLRAIVEPTLFSYRLKIISDQYHIDSLFEDAFRVETGLKFDSDEYKDFRKNLLNEPFKLQHALPIKIRFLPEENLLFISVHHIPCDGVGWVHMASSLANILNENEVTPVKVDDPSMVPGLFKSPYITAPRQLFDSWRLHSADKKEHSHDKVINPASKQIDFFGSAGMHQHYLKHHLSELKPKAKEIGCSLNVYFLTAIARAFFNLYDDSKGDTVAIRLSYDLRPYFEKEKPLFGNYVTTSVLRAHRQDMDKPDVMMQKIQSQLSDALDRLKNKKLSYPWLIDKIFTFLGKKLYSQAILLAKKKSISQPTVHFSTVGSLDFLNKAGEKAKIKDVIATVPTFGLFMTLINIDGVFNINISYPSAEYQDEAIKSLIDTFEDEVGSLMTL